MLIQRRQTPKKKDLFPYLSLQTVTVALLAIQLLWFILSLDKLTLLPADPLHHQQANIFTEVASNLFTLIFVGRLGSEYQAKIGSKYYLTVMVILQIERCLLSFVLGMGSASLMIVNNSSSLSLYILSIVNIHKWKQNEMLQYRSEQKTVENYDLLDLNDTVIRLKHNQSQFMYESYTNKQFYFHNIANKEEKNQKNTSKQTKKIKKSAKFMEEVSSEAENYQLKIFKIVLFNFIAFSSYRSKQFIIFALTQLTVYLLFVTKTLKRMTFT